MSKEESIRYITASQLYNQDKEPFFLSEMDEDDVYVRKNISPRDQRILDEVSKSDNLKCLGHLSQGATSLVYLAEDGFGKKKVVKIEREYVGDLEVSMWDEFHRMVYARSALEKMKEGGCITHGRMAVIPESKVVRAGGQDVLIEDFIYGKSISDTFYKESLFVISPIECVQVIHQSLGVLGAFDREGYYFSDFKSAVVFIGGQRGDLQVSSVDFGHVDLLTNDELKLLNRLSQINLRRVVNMVICANTWDSCSARQDLVSHYAFIKGTQDTYNPASAYEDYYMFKSGLDPDKSPTLLHTLEVFADRSFVNDRKYSFENCESGLRAADQLLSLWNMPLVDLVSKYKDEMEEMEGGLTEDHTIDGSAFWAVSATRAVLLDLLDQTGGDVGIKSYISRVLSDSYIRCPLSASALEMKNYHYAESLAFLESGDLQKAVETMNEALSTMGSLEVCRAKYLLDLSVDIGLTSSQYSTLLKEISSFFQKGFTSSDKDLSTVIAETLTDVGIKSSTSKVYVFLPFLMEEMIVRSLPPSSDFPTKVWEQLSPEYRKWLDLRYGISAFKKGQSR